MPRYQSPLFPQELIDLFIEYVADNTASLLSCATTCSSFYTPSRRFLFSQIDLDMHTQPTSKRGAPTRSSRLNKTFQSHPHLIPLVKSVVVKRMFANERGSSCFLQQDCDSLEVLFKLSQLRRLTLVGHIHKDWTLVPPNLRSVIASICVSSSLKYITIDSLSNFPAHLLSNCTRLRNLELKSISKLSHDPSYPGLDDSYRHPPTLVRLESLTLDYTDAFGITKFINWMLEPHCNVDLTGLRHLKVNARRQHCYSWCFLASQMEFKFPLLESLEFGVIVPAASSDDLFASNVYSSLDLRPLASLRCVAINFRIQDVHDCRNLSRAISEILKKIPTSSPVERLLVSFSPVPSLRRLGDEVSAPQMRDISIADSGGFGALRICKLQMCGLAGETETEVTTALSRFFSSS